MPKANVKLSWKNSISTNIVRREILLNVDGIDTTFDILVGDTEHSIQVDANATVSFKTRVTSSINLGATSEPFSFPVGDLQAPQPDTELTGVVVEVVPDEETT